MDFAIHKKVYLIGAGPGDPDLLTVKAVKALSQSDVVLYDRLVSPEILSLVSPKAELKYVGKEDGFHSVPQEGISDLMIELASKYPYVARLKGGDPFIFGRGGEEYYALTALGLSCEVIPGITAATGAAASLGLPLTHREYSSELVFLTGHKKSSDEVRCDFNNIFLKNKTHVIYMGLKEMEGIMEKILSNNIGMENFPVMIVENATCANQRALIGTITTISLLAKEQHYKSPCLIFIGESIQLLQNKNKPLKVP